MTHRNKYITKTEYDLENKHRQHKKKLVIFAALGFIFMIAGLSFINGVGVHNWLIGLTTTIVLWTLLWLTLHFKLDRFFTFDPNFLLIPAAASAILICVFVHLFPDLRLLLLNGWFVVSLFGAGLLTFKNAIYLNTFMITAHVINTGLLISKGEPLIFSNEMALFLPYILMWTYLAFVLDRVRARRNENKEMRQMLSNLLIKKNQLLTDISHELSTPLTILKLQIESLQDELEDDVQATYKAIDIKLTDLESLIRDLQLYTASDSGTLKLDITQFNLSKILDEWRPELELNATSSSLALEYVNQLPSVFNISCDKNKLKQVILNLFENSVKYTHSPGKIRLISKVVNNQLQLIIEDSAPGIPNKHLTRIFERLYRVDDSRSRETGGTGLGLAICKGLIDAHQGIIWAEQSKLGGLSIIIELPLTLPEYDD